MKRRERLDEVALEMFRRPGPVGGGEAHAPAIRTDREPWRPTGLVP